MFYESCAVESILKCSFCDLRFIDEIKIIPECGNSICGDCFEDLKTKFERKSQFDCRACDERHVVSISSVGDNKSLLKMLQLRPKERGLTDRAKLLKSFLLVVQEQVDELKQVNKQDEVNAYCDSLEMEVMETLESSIKHLSDIGASLLSEIKDYRSQLLNARPTGQYESSTESPEPEDSLEEPGTDQELEKLSAEIKQFSQEWTNKIELISESFGDQEIQKADFKARDLYFKARLLKTNLRREMFDGRFLRFKENDKFFQSKEYVGRMVCDDSERRNLVNSKFSCFERG